MDYTRINQCRRLCRIVAHKEIVNVKYLCALSFCPAAIQADRPRPLIVNQCEVPAVYKNVND